MPQKLETRRRYPKNWREIRWRILARADYRCENCGVRHGDPHPVTGKEVTLQIAHLDHTPENCADDNLRAWCARCHGRYDGQRMAEERRDTYWSNLAAQAAAYLAR